MNRVPLLEDLNLKRVDFPIDIIVETCSFCNLSCIMCPYPTMKRPKGEMAFSTFKKIADEIAREAPAKSRLWVAIIGEPLLRGPALIEMLDYAARTGVQNIHLNTNATFLTAELADQLLALDLKEILISLDALTKETYDRIRVGGDFDRVMKNIEYLLDRKKKMAGKGPAVIVQMIVMDENAHEADAFREYWLARGVIVKIRLKCGWGTICSTEDLDSAAVKRDFPCPWLVRAALVQWNGAFAQCDADFEATYSPGSILKQSIKEVWNTELAQRREKHWNLDFSHPLCSPCKDWSVGRARFYYPDK
ncbi:MAG: radical SAM protein [Chitinispirillaceae bacterium]|jgi:sulfatase maturation enzyme AslB (radical SAM superfamily)|nr:radical SAM protein [Chitinispirillaceae bacterium]